MISLRAMSVSEVRGAGFDHWPMPQTKLTHALGNNVDKQLRVRNDLAGFLQELSRHIAQGVDGAGGLRRELENRRRAGRNGTRKKTRAEHRDERNGECAEVGASLSTDFSRGRGIHRGLANVFDVAGDSGNR